MNIKFKIGDKVKSKNSNDVCEVLGMTISAEGVVYKVSSKELDLVAKEVVNGVSFYGQEELEAVK